MKNEYLKFNKNCKQCGESFTKKANLGKKNWELKKYCSRKCSHIAQKGVLGKLKHTEDFKKSVSLRHTGKKVSLETRKKLSESKKGAKNHNWKGGISTEYHLQRASMENRLWRTAVFERDNYTCVWCFRKGGWSKTDKRQIILNADHIKPFIDYPELRLAIDNGRTLCVDCHRTTDTYGRKSKIHLTTNN